MIAGFQHTILVVITLEIPTIYMIVCFIQDIKKSKFSTPDLTLEQKKLYRMAWSGINHIQIYEKSMVNVIVAFLIIFAVSVLAYGIWCILAV